VNLLNDHEVTVEDPKIQATISSPIIGRIENKFKITKAAQYDILPATTTYPVKAIANDSINIDAPTNQIRDLFGEVIFI
jgi:hypothetical protein